MSTAVDCPSRSQFEQMLSGQCHPDEIDRVAGHLEHCTRCAAVADELLNSQLGVAAAKLQDRELQKLQRPVVVDLIEQFLQTSRSSAAAAETSAECETLAGNATPPPAGDFQKLLAPPRGEDEIGWLGPYRVLRLLGSGGMGAVFEAEDPQLHRRVALKVMRPTAAEKAESAQRFSREARAMAAVQHENVVTVYQVGEDRGIPFVAMEYLQGEALDARLLREERLSAAETVRIGREVAAGLAAAHQQGLIHRDVKPANIWIEARRGRVKLLDFGLARATDNGGQGDVQLTQEGVIVGTPAYMSPEQAGGRPVDARTDLFSLGAVLYRLCTGQPAFKGRDVIGTLMAVCSETPPAPAEVTGDVPAELSALIMRLLSKEPEDRPASAEAAGDELAAIEQKLGAGARQPGPATPPAANYGTVAEGSLFSRRRRPILAAGVALALLIPLTWAYAGTIIRFATNRGEVVIETDAADIEVSIRSVGGQQQASIVDRQTKREYTLTPGEYEFDVRLKDAGGETRFLTRRLTIARGEKEVLSARLELAKDEPRGSAPPITTVNPQGEKPAVPLGDPGDPTPRKSRPTIATTEPMSPLALVQKPAKLPGIKSWTIETLVTRGNVRSSAFSPDGQQLATMGPDGTIRIWDVRSGRLQQMLVGHSGWQSGDGKRLQMLSWSPDGKKLASAGQDATARIWNVLAGHSERVIPFVAKSKVTAIAWSPDGKWLAINNQGHKTGIWNTDTGEFVHVLAGQGEFRRFAWSPDSQLLAGARFSHSADTEVRLWEAGTGETRASLTVRGINGNQHPGLEWSPAGEYLFFHGTEPKIWIYSTATGEELPSPELPPGDLYTAMWRQEPQRLAIVQNLPTGYKPTLRHFRLGESAPLDSSPMPGSPGSWSPDGNAVVLLDYGAKSSLRVLAVDSQAPATTLAPGSPYVSEGWQPIRWSPDGRRLLAGAPGDTHRAVCWDVQRAQMHRAWTSFANGYYGFAWPPIGDHLFTQGENNSPRIWDTQNLESLGAFTRISGAGSAGTVLAASNDGRLLATRANDKQIQLWRTSSRSAALLLAGHEASVVALSFSPGGDLLASGANDKAVKLWDTSTGELVRDWKVHGARVASLAWSADGTLLASGSEDKSIRIWDPTSESPRHTLGCPGSVSDLQFAAGAPILKAICRASNFILVWNVETGELVSQTPSPARFGALSPDGRLVASHTGVNSIWVWDSGSGAVHGTLLPLPEDQGLVISPEGHVRARSAEGLAEALRHVRYVVETDAGQETLTADEFAAKYGWKNDPDAVELLASQTSTASSGSRNETADQPAALSSTPIVKSSAVVKRDPPALTALDIDAKGAALTPTALVRIPVQISGVRSWTMETLATRGAVRSAAFSPDGQQLATMGVDATIRIWDVVSGKLRRMLVGHSGYKGLGRQELSWSPDGSRLLSGGSDATVRIWDMESGRTERIMRFDAATKVTCVAWSPDGKWLAIDNQGKMVGVWSVETGQLIHDFTGSAGEIRRFAWSPDSQRLAAAFFTRSGETTVHLWRPLIGEVERMHTVPSGDVRERVWLEWSPDGEYLAYHHSGEASARIWNGTTGEELPRPELAAGSLMSSRWQTQPLRLIVAHNSSAGRTLQHFEPGKPEPLEAFPVAATVNCWSPDGNRFASLDFTSAGGPLKVVSTTGQSVTMDQRSPHIASATCLQWAPNNDRLCCLSPGDPYRADVWNVRERTFEGAVAPFGRGGHGDSDVAWSPTGEQFMVLYGGNLTLIERKKLLPEPFKKVDARFNAYQQPALAWSRDGSLAASVHHNALVIWDARSRNPRSIVQEPIFSVADLEFSADSARLAAALRDKENSVAIWDPLAGHESRRLRGHTGNVNAVAWSPDGKFLASGGSGDNAIRIWNPNNGDAVRVLKNRGVVTALRWLQDGSLLALNDNPNWTVTWDVQTGEPMRQWPALSGRGEFSHDGRWVASRSHDNLVWIWTTATGNLEATLLPLPDKQGLVISPEGHVRAASPEALARALEQVRYVVETEAGQETLTADEFAAKYGWKNDPERVIFQEAEGR